MPRLKMMDTRDVISATPSSPPGRVPYRAYQRVDPVRISIPARGDHAPGQHGHAQQDQHATNQRGFPPLN
ncbi:MAG: hypothetical protein ACYCS8_00765 [Acidithiobacillus sp.]